MTELKVNDRVLVPGIGAGYVARILHDDRGGAIYTINLDDKTATSAGLYYARDCELREESTVAEKMKERRLSWGGN